MKFENLYNLLSEEIEKFSPRETPIGLEFYATELIEPSEIVGLLATLTTDKPTYTSLGQFVSRSEEPNTELRKDGDQIYLVALRDILPDELITANYEEDDLNDTPPFDIIISHSESIALLMN